LLCIKAGAALSAALFMLALAGPLYPVAAAVYYVTKAGSDDNGGTGWNDAFNTIQRGIDAASDGDSVVVADGTYTGAGNKNIELLGKAISVQSSNGPQNCVIDCEISGRGFHIHQWEGLDTVISGFSIINGAVPGDYGGDVYCNGTSSISSTATIYNWINNCSPLVTYSAGTGFAGEGNIEVPPLFIRITDPDPEKWNLRLQ
jgi:hypothetical protein